MIKLLYDPPAIVKNIFSDFIWESRNDKILLTFDDGPDPNTTEIILRNLNRFNIKALFFCVGNNVCKYSSLVEEIIKEGHTLGNHTFNHRSVVKLYRNQVLEEIQFTNLCFKEKFGIDIKYFRPPFGRFSLSLSGLLREINMTGILWSLLTYDYKNDYNIVKFSIENYLKNNSIVVMHDRLKNERIMQESIEYLFENASRKNFNFGDPSECLK